MRIKGKLISLTISSALVIGLSACGGGGGGDSASGSQTTKEIQVASNSFNYALTSVYSGSYQESRSLKKASQRELKIYTGELQAKNVTTGEETTFNWSAYINDETFDVVSNKTVVLTPGSYEFSLLLSNGGNQYISESVYEVEDEAQVNIPFNLKPVIGNVITDVSVIEEIPSMKFKYDVGELSSYSDPRISIRVDEEETQYLTINPTTGLSDSYINIPSGEHEISLDFFDGNIYLGRSSKYPATMTITPKEDINLDLVALHGEATLGLDIEKSTLDMTLNIPSQIVVESEGIDNLQTILRYSDSNQTVEKEVTNIESSGSDYQGSITLQDITYGEFTFSLEFSDKSDNNELIGSCDVDTFTISEDNNTVNCEVSLRKRSNITGNLLATVGLNVFNTEMEPIEGAKLYLNDDYLGLSGSGDFGTKGYLKQYIKKGEHSLVVKKDNLIGKKDLSLSPLSVNNFDVILDIDPSTIPSASNVKDAYIGDNSDTYKDGGFVKIDNNIYYWDGTYWRDVETGEIIRYEDIVSGKILNYQQTHYDYFGLSWQTEEERRIWRKNHFLIDDKQRGGYYLASYQIKDDILIAGSQSYSGAGSTLHCNEGSELYTVTKHTITGHGTIPLIQCGFPIRDCPENYVQNTLNQCAKFLPI